MKKFMLLGSGLLFLLGCSGSSENSPSPTNPVVVVNSPATFSGATTSQISADSQSVSAKVDVSDADAGQANITVQNASSGTYGSFSIASDGQWTYTLNTQNAVLIALPLNTEVTDTFAITSSDNTASQVVLTITGVNDVPSFGEGQGVDSATITNQQSDVINGSLSIDDSDTGESAFTPQTEVSTTFGTFSINSQGDWLYTLDTTNNAVFV